MDEQSWTLRLPRGPAVAPAVAIARRVAIAVALVFVNWALVMVEKDGYQDSYDGSLSAVDSLYYTTVTLSTTGYGDITPVTTSARLTNALIVTPMRFLFVLVLVGTTIQVLTERSRDQFKVARWRLACRTTSSSAAMAPRGAARCAHCVSATSRRSRSSWSRQTRTRSGRPPPTVWSPCRG